MKAKPFTHFLMWMTSLFVTICVAMYLVATGVIAEGREPWSILKAHKQANQTLVQIGDYCSGTIIDKDKGLVVTAAHCAEESHVKGTNKFTRQDTGHTFVVKIDYYKPIIVTRYIFSDTGDETGRIEYTMRVLASVFPTDIAILENISEEKFPGEVMMSTAPVHYGDKVYTVGNPLGFLQTIADGNISKPKHTIDFGSGEVTVMGFTAYMKPGSSGGGVFNDNGELIGITNWGLPGGPYLASPASNVITVLQSLAGNNTDKIASVQ